jgi:hypothetical protein
LFARSVDLQVRRFRHFEKRPSGNLSAAITALIGEATDSLAGSGSKPGTTGRSHSHHVGKRDLHARNVKRRPPWRGPLWH